MFCPNCDGILNAIGCQACGWHTGDPFPAHRLEPGTAHPLKPGDGMYPPREGEPVKVATVVEPPPVEIQTPAVPPPVASPKPEPAPQPGPPPPPAGIGRNPEAKQVEAVIQPEAPIADPLTKTVQ